MENFAGESMRHRLLALEKRHLQRHLEPVNKGTEPWLEMSGHRLLNLSSNNYLGLATHPEVQSAAAKAALAEGCGAGSSRLIAGNSTLYHTLEKRLAQFKHVEATLVYTSGYSANVGVIPAMVGPGDVILGDELNHASIIDGCRLSRAEFLTYSHSNVGSLKSLMTTLDQQGHKGHRLVVTDTVFSMDGDIVLLPDLVDVCRQHNAILMVDEAHATGCIGPGGRGAVAHFGLEKSVPVAMSTLSKALGSFGAFVAGDALLREYLVNVSRSFIFTTALPPTVVAASLAALDILEQQPELVHQLQENGKYLRTGLQAMGFDTMASETHIMPIRVGDAAKTLEFSRRLRDQGVYAVAIRPPTVPPRSSRIRLSVMATHTREDLDFALSAFGKVGRSLNLIV